MKSLKELYRIGTGPSSSHTMGPENACKYILKKYDNSYIFRVTLYGSLALTGKGHFTDAIILKTLGSDTTIIFDYKTIMPHPNTLKVECFKNSKVVAEHIFYSIGGGEILMDNEERMESDDLYPFKSFDEIRDYSIKNNISLADIVYKFDYPDIKEYLNEVYDTMIASINRGLNSKGILPGELKVKRKANEIFNSNVDGRKEDLKNICAFAYAVSEENASGGVIVTAPTCGSSGVVPSVLYFLEKYKNIPREKIIDGLAVGGLIGNVIKRNGSISGALAGCQAEVGSACSMAAGIIAYINELSLEQIEASIEIAMEHHLGLTCDPIDGLVQIPCIERNAVAALRAFDAANLATLPIYPEKLSFDEVVKTMLQTGKDISTMYKETSLAGLANAKIER